MSNPLIVFYYKSIHNRIKVQTPYMLFQLESFDCEEQEITSNL